MNLIEILIFTKVVDVLVFLGIVLIAIVTIVWEAYKDHEQKNQEKES
ncbi:hypothetical protein [Streptococcus suis]|nr:hypothetical protein [Streptococcus suis]MBO4130966.1 hypothetical protein [Streptococcus suis]MBO4133678.1 hypothetical protein [Streptococcus suis]MCK3990854.1 hypothetical protein [Streptococcus suis]MCK4050595.1 hypothetical protein [Streptococcus suis]MCO8199359.1 hypothetical protein [Streptococcus suis]